MLPCSGAFSLSFLWLLTSFVQLTAGVVLDLDYREWIHDTVGHISCVCVCVRFWRAEQRQKTQR